MGPGSSARQYGAGSFLTDALLHAQDYVDLAGEMPTQNAAMLRLLLAVLFTVFSRWMQRGKPQPLAKR